MAPKKKLNIDLSSEAIAALGEIAKDTQTGSERIRNELAVQWANSIDRPLEVILPNGEHFYNKTAQEQAIIERDMQREIISDLRAENATLQTEIEDRRKEHSKDSNTFFRRFWNAVELKPGFAGFSINLKLLFGWDQV